MQTKNKKSCSGTKNNGAKIRRTVEVVLVLLGLFYILISAMLSDAESIGKSELLFGMLVGVAHLLGGVYLQKVELLFRLLFKHLMHYAAIVNKHIIVEVRAQRPDSNTTEPMGVSADALQKGKTKKKLSGPVGIEISYDNIIPLDTSQAAS